MAGWLDSEVLLQTPSRRKTDSVFWCSSLGVTDVQDSDGLSADAVQVDTGVAIFSRGLGQWSVGQVPQGLSSDR